MNTRLHTFTIRENTIELAMREFVSKLDETMIKRYGGELRPAATSHNVIYDPTDKQWILTVFVWIDYIEESE